MKHQIALVGGQMLPIAIGVREFSPDYLYLIGSEESKVRMKSLRNYLKIPNAFEHVCNPLNFSTVKETCSRIVNKIPSDDEIIFNLTGGTKIMMLAAQAVMTEREKKGFYINQDNTILNLPDNSSSPINTKFSVSDFLNLSNHTIGQYKMISDFSDTDFTAANSIQKLCEYDYRYKLILKCVGQKFGAKKDIPKTGQITINNNLEVTWDKNTINIVDFKKGTLSFSALNIHYLFFKSGWWELSVAKEVSNWANGQELLLNVELPFKTDIGDLKNEVDVLLCIKNRLVFIECKSGRILNSDINKMKIIQETYGGVISKSLLVSFEMPTNNIMEKCKELGIEVYFYKLGNVKNGFQKLNQALQKALNTPNI